MKTTEIFVEQVIIGAVVTGIIIILYEQGMPCIPWETKTLEAIAISSGFVLISYLMGIIYDRCADTMLKDLEQHHRLKVGLEKEDLNKAIVRDPFPEDDIRTWTYVKGEAAINEYADYLRSRMRLTRSLATLMPAIGLTFLLFEIDEQSIWVTGTLILAISYGLSLICKVFEFGCKPPKTDKLKKLSDYIKRHRKPGKNELTIWKKDLFCEPLLWSLVIIVGFEGFAIGDALINKIQLSWISLISLLVSTVLTFLVGWCWWRISNTFFSLLLSVKKNKDLIN